MAARPFSPWEAGVPSSLNWAGVRPSYWARVQISLTTPKAGIAATRAATRRVTRRTRRARGSTGLAGFTPGWKTHCKARRSVDLLR